MTTWQLRVDCRDDVGEAVAGVVGALAGEAALGVREAYRLRLAADEITTNIAAYGYQGQGGMVDIEAGYDAARVWLTIVDDAPRFDPREHDATPAVQGPPQEGGYGIFLARNGVDEFSYEWADGRNRNTLLVRRPVDPAGSSTEQGGFDGRQDCARRR